MNISEKMGQFGLCHEIVNYWALSEMDGTLMLMATLAAERERTEVLTLGIEAFTVVILKSQGNQISLTFFISMTSFVMITWH